MNNHVSDTESVSSVPYTDCCKLKLFNHDPVKCGSVGV